MSALCSFQNYKMVFCAFYNSWENPVIGVGINDMIQITTIGDYVGRGLSTEFGTYDDTLMKELGYRQIELESSSNWWDPFGIHGTGSVDVEQLNNSNIEKLKPVPKDNLPSN